MADLSSDSSDSDQDTVISEENEESSLDLNTVNKCIRDYEKEQKKERKKQLMRGSRPKMSLLTSPIGLAFENQVDGYPGQTVTGQGAL